MEAARSLGASNSRIIFREILPNLVAPIIVYGTILIPQVILFEAALSFLGIGIEPGTPSWGSMISDAVGVFDIAWWFMTFPGLALLLTVLAFNLVGDGLQDALNPRTASNRHRSQASPSHGNNPGKDLCMIRLPLRLLAALALDRPDRFRRRLWLERRGIGRLGRQAPMAGPHQGQEGRQARTARRLRRRLPRPGPDVLHGGLQCSTPPRRRSTAPKPGQEDAGARPRRGPAGDLRRQEDGHRHAQEGRQVRPAGQPRGPGEGRQVRDRARVHQERAEPVHDRTSTSSRAPREAGRGQGRSPGIQIARTIPTRSRSSSPSRRRAGFAASLVMPITTPVPEGVRGEVRQGEPVDVQRERRRDRPVHGRERRRGQARRATRPASRSSSSATPTGTRARTSARRTSTRSCCARTRPTPTCPAARCCRART